MSIKVLIVSVIGAATVAAAAAGGYSALRHNAADMAAARSASLAPADTSGAVVEPPPQARVEPAPAQPVSPPPRAQAPALDPNVLHDYGAIVSNAVAKKKVYPRLALMRRWQGTSELKLQVGADGNIKALTVSHSSGFGILDDQAMKMVKDSIPLPTLPDALRGREFALDIPVAFKLQE